jgi:hypothetical protein
MITTQKQFLLEKQKKVKIYQQLILHLIIQKV